MVYLDHAATTPLHPEAFEAMSAELLRVGNPSSLHTSGRRARRVVEESRERLAAVLGARPSEVVLTGGGTESDNLAVKGLFWSRLADDPRRVRVLATAVEHHAVLDPLEWLAAHEGAKVELVPVDAAGRVDVDALRDAVEREPESVALITVMWANNEVGTTQPIVDVVAIGHEHGIPVHSDAVQAVPQVEVDFAGSGLDAMTVSSHKLGGPLGVGALLLRRGVAPVPLLHGGGQERDVRSGTLDSPAAAGFAAAADVAVGGRAEHADHLRRLRDRVVAGVREVVPDAELNGDHRLDDAHRLPANAHFSFPGCEGDSLLMLLDARGVEVSTGSACSSGVAEPSHVLLAMGRDPRSARTSLRFSVGRTSTDADVETLLDVLPAVVERARRAGMRRI